MKFTNVKQLIIKFMGGGLINFPTRFLRWVKINGDTEDDGSDDGGSDKIDAFNEDYFYPMKSPAIGVINAETINNNIDWGSYDWQNPLNSPTYNLDTNILKTFDEIVSYISTVPISIWPAEFEFLLVYDIEEINKHNIYDKLIFDYLIYKEENSEPKLSAIISGSCIPIKVNINNKTYCIFTQSD